MSNRYIAAACLWGIALGALVYRYGMLPLAWSSTWKHLLPGFAAGLAVAGYHLVRDANARTPSGEVKRPPIAALFALGVAGALLAFGLSYVAFPGLDRAPIAKREFPGFSLAVPDGEVVEDSSVYANGKLMLKDVHGAGGVFILQWQPGAAMTPDELELVAGLMGPALGKDVQGKAKVASVPGPDGKPVDTIVFGGDSSFTLSVLTCGIRQVLVATGAASDTMALHRRIVASFQCRPDPKQEATAKVVFPLVIDLPGWYLAVEEPDQIQITDGVTANLTMRTFPRDFKVDLELVLEPIFRASGTQAKIGTKVGDRIPLTLIDGEDQIQGWAGLFPCPTSTAMVLALADEQAVLDRLYDRVKSARCLRAGEPPQAWPPAPAETGDQPASGSAAPP